MYKVLIVEDEDIIRKGLMFMVDWTRVDCVIAGEAADGEEGLAKIRALSPDIVITDIKMPGMDGLQMLEESICEYGYEAIIVSGYGEFEYAQKGIRLGVTEYLLKPVDFNRLYETIEKITRKLNSATQMKGYLEQAERTLELEKQPEWRLPDLESVKSRPVREMLEYIKLEFQRRISLVELSERLGLSCTYLNSKFKAETGYTFNDFLNRYRISQAVELLRADELKVYAIAEMVGFSDYKYFIKVFKKYAGCSPIKFLSSQKML